VYRTERLLKDNQEKMSGDNRSKVESALNEVKEALKGSDVAAMKTASEKLNEAWQAASAELYKAASEKAHAGKGSATGQSRTQPEAEGSTEGGKQDEGPIIDAEVVEEKKAA
jgi:molecular chaperone DnaK